MAVLADRGEDGGKDGGEGACVPASVAIRGRPGRRCQVAVEHRGLDAAVQDPQRLFESDLLLKWRSFQSETWPFPGQSSDWAILSSQIHSPRRCASRADANPLVVAMLPP